jgi:hypothetical protein
VHTDEQIVEEAKRRFSAAKTASADQREDYKRCVRMAFGDQWDPAARSARETAGRPALSFPVLHTYVQRVTNKAREQRPQPLVKALGQGASQKVADVYEGIFRHVHTVSGADVAYDTAVECAASGGFGYYEFTTAYVDDKTFDQEPRICRILDPLSVYFDPNAIEPDYSDAKYYFKRRKLHKDEFKNEFGKEPATDWGEDDEHKQDWSDGDNVYIAEYCFVHEQPRDLLLMPDGQTGFADDIAKVPQYHGVEPINKRNVIERKIKKCILDGQRVLEKTEWLGKWLPMVPVLGKEVIVDGKRKLFSVIHFSLDGQKLINATGTGVAEQLQLAARSPWVGPKGSMKDKRWDDSTKNWSKLEYEAFDEEGRQLPAPMRNTYEAPVQALTQSMMVFTDGVKKSIGYVDTVQNPSQADLSGIAVQRREQQSDLTNMHFQDNLSRSQWHGGRILLDLIQKYIDTPRAMRILKMDGAVTMQAVTMAMEDGMVPEVAGYEGQPHIRLDVGQYDVTISTGPGYASRLEAETDVLLKTLQADPNLWGGFADVLFKLMGYPELEQRARMLLPPQIQQAIAGEEQNISPEAQSKIMQLAQQLQHSQEQLQGLAGAIQKLMFERQAKIIESETKVHVAAMDNETKLRIAGLNAEADVTVQAMKHGQETATNIHDADTQWRMRLMEILRDFSVSQAANQQAAMAGRVN